MPSQKRTKVAYLLIYSPRQSFHVEMMAAIEKNRALLRGPRQVTQAERGGDGRGEGAAFAAARAAQHAPGRRRRRALGRDEGEERRKECGGDDEAWQHFVGCVVCGAPGCVCALCWGVGGGIEKGWSERT